MCVFQIFLKAQERLKRTWIKGGKYVYIYEMSPKIFQVIGQVLTKTGNIPLKVVSSIRSALMKLMRVDPNDMGIHSISAKL